MFIIFCSIVSKQIATTILECRHALTCINYFVVLSPLPFHVVNYSLVAIALLIIKEGYYIMNS